MNAFMDEDDVVEGRFLVEENKRIAKLWEEDFRRLLYYVERNGHARVPKRGDDASEIRRHVLKD